jgi:glutathione S-transferase
MKCGIFLSPYIRRVAVSLHLLKLPFEFEEVFVFGEPDIVRRTIAGIRVSAL